MFASRVFLGIALTTAAKLPHGAAPDVKNPYQVKQVTPVAVSSPMWESHPAVDPRNGDLWFVRSKPDFSGWEIFISRCVDGKLQPPTESPLSTPGLEADPYFDQDGRTLYYISSGDTGSSSSADLDIWIATRNPSGRWNKPAKLPQPVNSKYAEWFPRPASDGWLYFGSRRPGGFGKDDIWRATQTANGIWHVENAGSDLNTENAEYEFLPAPNGQWGLLSTDKGIYRVERAQSGWRRAGLLDKEVNANGTEIGPMFLGADGSFVFSRDTGKDRSGELFLASMGNATIPFETCSSIHRR
jgi:hypothetical protein